MLAKNLSKVHCLANSLGLISLYIHTSRFEDIRLCNSRISMYKFTCILVLVALTKYVALLPKLIMLRTIQVRNFVRIIFRKAAVKTEAQILVNSVHPPDCL